MKASLARVTKENQSLKEQLYKNTEKLNKQIAETDNLWSSIDDLEEYTRKNSLEVVLKIGNALKVAVSPQDIEILHKIKRRGSSSIIVKFISHKVKSRLYKERVKLKHFI